MIKKISYLIIIILGFNAVNAQVENLEKYEIAVDSDWISLFDGSSLDGWRAFNGTELPEKWNIIDGVLTFDTVERLEAEHYGGNDIIYADEEFENFELYLEWKLPEGGNSGILYHLKEGLGGMPEIGTEYQL